MIVYGLYVEHALSFVGLDVADALLDSQDNSTLPSQFDSQDVSVASLADEIGDP